MVLSRLRDDPFNMSKLIVIVGITGTQVILSLHYSVSPYTNIQFPLAGPPKMHSNLPKLSPFFFHFRKYTSLAQITFY